jgi:hypothetical protein
VLVQTTIDKLIALADNVMLMAWQFKVVNDKVIALKVCSAVVQWRGAGCCRGKKQQRSDTSR